MLHISRWQTVAILAVVLLGLGFAAPNLLSRDRAESLPDWVPNQQINLGLDLQGGSYLLLEVDVDEVQSDLYDALVDEVRVALRGQQLGYADLQRDGDAVSFQLRDADSETVEQARRAIQAIADEITVQIDASGAASVGYASDFMEERARNLVTQAIEIIRRRIDETGTREPSIQRQGEQRIVVQLPGIDDPERMKELLGQTAQLTFHFVDDDVMPGRDSIPAGSQVLPSEELGPDGEPLREYSVRRRIMVSGENLVDAQATYQDGQPVVSFRFDSVGARRFADATREGVGRVFAIVLDDKVISAPVIREPILGGSGVISGSFTVQEVSDLALLLRAGALPAPLTVLEERTVGPGLGADSVRAGQIASIIGLIAVMVAMTAVYGLFGLLANVALIGNLVLILGALSGLQATLTLPGIAGIVLTLGMAVDANVLIFERIREEAANQRGPVSAIDAGYRRALTTILDANITTLIAALILFFFGTGPIRGFAVTLSIGLVTSMFTAIMVTRLMVVIWLRRKRPQALPI